MLQSQIFEILVCLTHTHPKPRQIWVWILWCTLTSGSGERKLESHDDRDNNEFRLSNLIPLVLYVSFATFRWTETKEIEIGELDWITLQMRQAVLVLYVWHDLRVAWSSCCMIFVLHFVVPTWLPLVTPAPSLLLLYKTLQDTAPLYSCFTCCTLRWLLDYFSWHLHPNTSVDKLFLYCFFTRHCNTLRRFTPALLVALRGAYSTISRDFYTLYFQH